MQKTFTKMGSKEWRQQLDIYMKHSAYAGECFKRLRRDPQNQKKKAEFYRSIARAKQSRPPHSQEFLELMKDYHRVQEKLKKDPFNLKLLDQSTAELRKALRLPLETTQAQRERHHRYQKVHDRFKKFDLPMKK